MNDMKLQFYKRIGEIHQNIFPDMSIATFLEDFQLYLKSYTKENPSDSKMLSFLEEFVDHESHP